MMPEVPSEDLSAVKGLLVNLIELEDVSTASQVLAPNLQLLFSSNVTLAASELEEELASAGMLPLPEGPASIAAALDFVLSFLEEVAEQFGAMQERHQLLLKEVLMAAQQQHLPSSNTNAEADLDRVLVRNRYQLDSSFLLFLRSERCRLEALVK
jgi:hypothetical protein